MKSVDIEVFFESDATSQLSELGIDASFDDYEVRLVSFYRIDAISPYVVDEKEYSTVHSGGSNFIANISYENLKTKLNHELNF